MTDYNPFTLAGKTVAVTGASAGIGRAIAVQCSRLGAHVVITGRDARRLAETLAMMEGEDHEQVVADLTQGADIDRLADAVPTLDGLVNNAGIGMTQLVKFLKADDLSLTFGTNVFAPALLTRAMLRRRKLRRGASLVFTSSISARLSTPANGVYAASKAALTSFMRTCAVELAPQGIRSNAVMPGAIETEMSLALPPDLIEADRQHYPLHRYGQADEVAYAVVYLLSDATTWITGTSLVIDGGRLLN